MSQRPSSCLLALALLLGTAASHPLLADETPAQPSTGNSSTTSNQQSSTFTGLGFGVGVTLTQDFGEHDRVDEAELVNGIVRVTKERNSIARLMLETHYFFTVEDARFFRVVPPKRWGWGPFLAVQSGDDDFIEAIGFGLMVGLQREGVEAVAKRQSFNVGLGVVVDPKVQVLGDGITANAGLPPGETEIRFLEQDQWGYLLAFSFSF